MADKARRGEVTHDPLGEVSGTPPIAVPPQGSRWQLITSSILVGLWMIFLAWMAFTG